MNKTYKSEKGVASIIFILIILVLIGVIIYMYFGGIPSSPEPSTTNLETTTMIVKESEEEELPEAEDVFERLDEDETTPNEINNETVDELDSLIKSVDSTEEDIADLDL
ncbi:hypothetical protein ACFL0C_01555 [Patescibacteria group bacterium]